MESIISECLAEAKRAMDEFAYLHQQNIINLVQMIANALEQGNKILIFGNGGSAADAQHMAAEFVNRFLIDRKPLAAIALTTDTSILTSIGNDFSFDDIFLKQLQALGKKGDIALGISTSGNSANVINTVREAAKMGMGTAVLTGGDGGLLASMADIVLNVPSKATPHIQEVHLWAEHVLCRLVDEKLFGSLKSQ